MSENIPTGDQRPQDREDSEAPLDNVARAEAARASAGTIAVPVAAAGSGLDLSYESGVEVKARSQWAYARMRFFRHRLAVASLVILILIVLVAIFARFVAPYGFNDQDYLNIAQGPSKDHWFGTDLLGRDYLSRVIYGLQTSLWVAFFVAVLSTIIGTVVGAFAGYYGGTVDNLLMRFTDLILTLPGLAVLLTAAAFIGQETQKIGPVEISQQVMIGLQTPLAAGQAPAGARPRQCARV